MDVLLKCQVCEKEYSLPPSQAKKSKYCSKKCSYVAKVKVRGTRNCKACGKEFVVTRINPGQEFCNRTCSNRHTAKNRETTKGFVITTKGYVLTLLPTHPHSGKNGYVMEHRLVMEAFLSRFLTANEVVHHKNGKKDDNRLENLELLEKCKHDSLPKPPVKPIKCPHCGGMIKTSGRVVNVEAM